MDAKLFGKNVLLIRKERRLNQEQLANLAAVSRNYISMIERGEADNVSDGVMRKLSAALEVSFQELTGEPGETSSVRLPPALREFGIKEGVSFRVIDQLMKIPFRGREPKTIQEWKELYEAVKQFLSED